MWPTASTPASAPAPASSPITSPSAHSTTSHSAPEAPPDASDQAAPARASTRPGSGRCGSSDSATVTAAAGAAEHRLAVVAVACNRVDPPELFRLRLQDAPGRDERARHDLGRGTGRGRGRGHG